VTGQDDLADLQRTFNDMLDRLESAFNTQRQLLDDAGHELRTPLTILRGHLEVLDQADPDDVSATRALLLDETDRMARLVDDLLVLAKARRPDFVVAASTDVELLTQGVLDRARGLADRQWVLDGVARTSAPLDGQRVTQALLQLADNAVRHTQPGDQIGIGSRLHEGQLELWVRDTGSGVDPAVRQQIFHRFVRDDDGGDGFGLGLSIVTAIAEAHGGRATLDDTSPGATFRVQVPRGAAW
jgi:two-component system OmpR family sensor kinase